MIYTVECSFADPFSEAEWNDFYSLDKLPALISVSGFHTSQRFKALSRGCPVYLALHSIDGLDILTGEEYRQKGGGNFARWQQHITDWHRRLNDISDSRSRRSRGRRHLWRGGASAPVAAGSLQRSKSSKRTLPVMSEPHLSARPCSRERPHAGGSGRCASALFRAQPMRKDRGPLAPDQKRPAFLAIIAALVRLRASSLRQSVLTCSLTVTS